MRLLFVLALLAGCQQAEKTEPGRSTSAPSGAAAVPAASAVPAKAWYEGRWQGDFQAELARIEPSPGAIREWKSDDGKKSSGPGKLSLTIDGDGLVTGTATGALGDLVVAGRVEGDRAALSLTSLPPDGFHGVLLATQAAAGMSGTLNASSGDSLQVRKAAVTLARVP